MRQCFLPVTAFILISSPLVWAAQAQCSANVQLVAPGLSAKDRLGILEELKIGRDCSRSALSEMALARIRDLGFFRARLKPVATRTPLISITPRPQYLLGGFTAQGIHSLDAKQIRGAYAMQAGELASIRLMSQTQENIRKAYQHIGLRNVVIVPSLRFDEKARVIYVHLQVDEGTG